MSLGAGSTGRRRALRRGGGPLPRPVWRPSRDDRQGTDGRHLPARGRPPRWGAFPRSGRPTLVLHLATVRAPRHGAVLGAGQAVHVNLWSPFAWLGGDTPDARVLIELDGDRITSVTPGVGPSGDAERLHGLLIPGLANSHSHAF